MVYSYAPGRGHQHARALLGGYRGILPCDGYAAYKTLAKPAPDGGASTTWPAARRRRSRPKRLCASPRCIDRGWHPRQGGRAPAGSAPAESRKLVTDLRTWLEVQLARLPTRGPTADAIRYALNHWDGLERFLGDGRIEMDSNSIERTMRPVALSRKNALFAGSDEGGERWGAIASLVETCKLNGVNPQTYFTDLLTRLVNGWPQARLDELMPWNWAPDAT